VTVERLGATVVAGSTRFEVWVPDASSVEVGVERRGERSVHPLTRAPGAVSEADTWSAVVEGVGHGDRYRFRIDGDEWLADPASRWQPDGVHGPSAVVDEAVYRWTDDGWAGVALADAVIAEIHVGTFTPEGTFDAAIGQLERLRDVGITLVEVMPVSAFPGRRNWGYDGVFPFATQESYGGAEAFARFVDAAHGLGLGVLLDVVYNHFGPEGNVVGRYGPYFTDAYSTPWGAAVNVAEAGSDGVRRYFVENAVGWVRDLHLDGLRLDAVHAIVDPTASPFVAELTAAVRAEGERQGRTVLVTIESSANDPVIVRSREEHGWGCDAVWDDDVHHALRVALTGDDHEYYRAYRGVADLATAWERRWVFSGEYSASFGRRHGAPADDIDHRHFVVFATNHDHVGNTPRGERMLAAEGPADPRHRLGLAAILLSPFTPLLFMGEEYGETAPFPYFVDHVDPELIAAVREGRQREFSGADWTGTVADPADPETFRRAVLDPSLAEREPHRSRLAMTTELLRLRREVAVLTDPTADQRVSVAGDVMTVERRAGGTTATLVFNFSADTVDGPADGEVLFDTADERWSGTGASTAAPSDQLAPWSARLTVM
jgi:maltooligosyltrehalose trehalohydrolase